MAASHIATVQVPFEALVKELGTRRAIEFVSEISKCYGDSVIELRTDTETFTLEQIESEINAFKNKAKSTHK